MTGRVGQIRIRAATPFVAGEESTYPESTVKQMVTRQQQRWAEMLRRSWSPLQWYGGGTDLDFEKPAEGAKMWVYRRAESNLWTVGFYDPQGAWHADNDYGSPGEAAARVHYLNGGGGASTDVAAAARRGYEGR